MAKQKIIFFTLGCLMTLSGFAENDNTYDDLQVKLEQVVNKVNTLQSSLTLSQQEIEGLKEIVTVQKIEIDSLKDRIKSEDEEIAKVRQQMQDGLTETNRTITDASSILTNAMNRKSTIAGLIGLISLILGVVVFFVYRRKTEYNRTCISVFDGKLTKLEEAKQDINTNLVLTNEKVLGLIEKQLNVFEKEEHIGADEQDHSLAIAVANELTRIQQNLNHMDPSVKGLSQIKNRAKAIWTTLKTKQYDVPDLLGVKYHEGDNVVATMELNEELDVGIYRIKRVIKPQVSFKGKLIQAAEVVVEFNE